MAKKKFLNENGEQIWPITRVDCIYLENGETLNIENYIEIKDFNLVVNSLLSRITDLESILYSNVTMDSEGYYLTDSDGYLLLYGDDED